MSLKKGHKGSEGAAFLGFGGDLFRLRGQLGLKALWLVCLKNLEGLRRKVMKN